MSSITLKQIVEIYAEYAYNTKRSEDNDKVDKEQVKELLSQKVTDDVEKEICDKYKGKIIEELVNYNKEFLRKQGMRNLIVLITETVILSAIVGLLVNQGTDVLNYLKGVNCDLHSTSIIMLLLSVAIAVFVFLIYLRKFDECFGIKDEELENYIKELGKKLKG